MSRVSFILFYAMMLFCLTGYLNSGQALFLGIIFAFAFQSFQQNKIKTHSLLAISIVCIGAGMNLDVVAHVGAQGFAYTLIGISVTFLLGFSFSRFLKTNRNASILITAGTAICGGSAIAAVAPVIRAKNEEVSVALGIVFTLNAVALFIFPPIGHWFNLTEQQFGIWSALAIHDTSSVVGATLQYGPKALEVGTTVKLARALWIVPVTLITGHFVRNDGDVRVKPKFPIFILGFIVAAALVTYIPQLSSLGHIADTIGKRLMIVTLFVIGTSLKPTTLQTVGARPFVLGVSLWICVATATLALLLFQILK